jgi:hypothetical protein
LPQLIEWHNIQIETIDLLKDAIKMQEYAERRHKEVLDMIEALYDTSSDGASSVL